MSFQVNGSEPKVYLNITCDGKLLACYRFQMIDYFHSPTFDAKGQNCGKIQSILIKVYCPKFQLKRYLTFDLPSRQHALTRATNADVFLESSIFLCGLVARRK